MKVYKFGGASVRNADGVQNLLKIIGDERDLFIIVSAMGKTTNALEKVFQNRQISCIDGACGRRPPLRTTQAKS
jgi:aspartate kinase